MVAAFAPLLHRSVPAGLESIGGTAWNRILVACVIRRSLDGDPTVYSSYVLAFCFASVFFSLRPCKAFALRWSAILRILPRRSSPPQVDEIKRDLLL